MLCCETLPLTHYVILFNRDRVKNLVHMGLTVLVLVMGLETTHRCDTVKSSTLPRPSMGLRAYLPRSVGVVPGGSSRHIFHTWMVWAMTSSYSPAMRMLLESGHRGW